MAKLKPTLDSLDGLDDGLKSLYVQQNGKFVLDLDGLPPGAVDRSKLDEFRNNNVQLMQQLQQLQEQFKDVDPAKYREIMERERKVKDQELIDAGKIDELVAQRVERMQTDFNSQIQALKQANDDLQEAFGEVFGRYSSTLLMAELTRAVDSVGKVRKGALDDIIARAHNTWTLNDDGELVAMDGDRPLFGRDGKAPLSMAEWLGGLSEAAPHLFESSQGGGGRGSNDQGTNNQRVIAPGDNKSFISNLEAIAKGQVQVGSGN